MVNLGKSYWNVKRRLCFSANWKLENIIISSGPKIGKMDFAVGGFLWDVVLLFRTAKGFVSDGHGWNLNHGFCLPKLKLFSIILYYSERQSEWHDFTRGVPVVPLGVSIQPRNASLKVAGRFLFFWELKFRVEIITWRQNLNFRFLHSCGTESSWYGTIEF